MDDNNNTSGTALTFTSVEAMKYNDLKSKAAELGLDASGTKEDLVARITSHLGLEKTDDAGDTGAGDTNSDAGDSNEREGSNTASENASAGSTPKAKPLNEAQERAEDKKADRALRDSARAMKAALDKQPKVSIMIPFEAGENPETGKKVPFHVNINGYAVDYPRGQYIEVPRQIADMVRERLESEGKIGSQWRVDRDARKQEALG